jgi:hypothetical protein
MKKQKRIQMDDYPALGVCPFKRALKNLFLKSNVTTISKKNKKHTTKRHLVRLSLCTGFFNLAVYLY